MALTPGTKLGPYEILAPLGAGGMGEVYRASEARLGRTVALKVLRPDWARDPERRGRFEREAKVLAALSHPNIAAIYGLEQDALVLELVQGPNLSGPLPLEDAVPIARQICEALEYAHERGIVHRDLKPANIKVTADGTAKVLDFGLAKALAVEPSAEELANSPTLTHMATMAGAILGTAAYMAPEQARGKAVDRRADIWAFGCVLFEMLVGAPAFGGDAVADVLAAVMTREPDWSRLPAATPASLRALLRRCLQRDPRQRLQSIGDARIVLQEVERGEATPPPPAAGSGRGRWAVPTLAAAAAALAVGWFGGRALRPAGTARTDAPLVRFSLPPPPNASFGYGLALSPDGSQLAFVAAPAAGDAELWLRSLDSTQVHPVPGTDGASFPFWSPDSRSLGFFAAGHLKRVDLDSGAVRELAPTSLSNERGGAWAPDGTILYARDFVGPLLRIPAAGGAPEPASRVSRTGGSSRWPCLLPDGRHFLYLDFVPGLAGATLEVGVLGATAATPVLHLPASTNTVYADGYLLFQRDSALMAQPFDLARLRTFGTAQPIADDVRATSLMGPTGYVAFSASARGQLVLRQGDTTQVSQLTVVDRTGKAVRFIGPAGRHLGFALSPDRKFAVVAQPEPGPPGNTNLWRIAMADGAATRLTGDASDHNYPVWSRDGRWIYFGSNPNGSYDLYRMLSDGSRPAEMVWHSERLADPSDVSPDGRTLLFSNLGAAAYNDLYFMPTTPGAVPTRLVNAVGDDIGPIFSPDGHWILYQHTVSATQIMLAPFPPTGARYQASAEGGYWPSWGADGREIFYAIGSTLMASAFNPGPPPQFGVPHPLFALHTQLLVDNGLGEYLPLDAQHFLVNENAGAADALTVVLNWPSHVGSGH